MIDVSGIRPNSMPGGAGDVAVASSSMLSRLEGVSFAKADSANYAAAACMSFEHHFENEANALAGMLGPAGIADFSRDVRSKFESIVDRAFDALPRNASGLVEEADFDTVMASANKEASMALDRLKVDAARSHLMAGQGAVDARPQIIPKDGKLVVIRPAPQIENLVLRGGGAKGIGYSAALDQMEKAGVLSGVKHVAGSSAGALTAACLAGGLSAAEFERGPAEMLFRPSPLVALKGADAMTRAYPDLKVGGGLAPALSSLRVVDESTFNGVQGYLKENWGTPAFMSKLATMMPEEVERLSNLHTAVADFDGPHKDNLITFGDLKMMHEVAPEKFKELTLTGWNKTDKREEYFSADSTPDMPVAYAARISMAFPIAFKSVEMEQDGVQKVFSDGGIGSNLPAEVFDHVKGADGVRTPLADGARSEQKARTLLMTFDQGGKAYQVMHGGRPEPESLGFLGKIKAFFVNLITGHPDRTTATLADRQKLWDAGPNALPIFHGKLSTLSMNISDEVQHQTHMLSAWKALEQIEARMQQAYHSEYDSLEQLAGQLNDNEISALRAAPVLDDQQRQLLAILDHQPLSVAPTDPMLMLRV